MTVLVWAMAFVADSYGTARIRCRCLRRGHRLRCVTDGHCCLTCGRFFGYYD